MSPQPISIDKYPLEARGATDNLVLGEHPGPLLVIPKTLITKLWDHVREGIRSLTRGGLEVGGLLAGHKGSGGVAVVEEIIPLPIEYRQGPVFHMSPSDLSTIAPMVKLAHRSGKLVVGFYRSRTRGDELLRGSDIEILEAIERSHESYDKDFRGCFILAPKSLTLAAACVALRDETGWTELSPVTLHSNPAGIITASFGAEQRASHSPASISALIPTSAQRSPENHPTLVTPVAAAATPAPERARREGIWWYSALGLVGAAALWLAVAQIERAPSATQPETARTHLGFSATREGPVWKLVWDPAAMDTLNPIGGVLSIDDGAYEQQVPLAPPDLASGTLFYTPQQSGNLTFSLRIDRGGSHVEEHVRVVVAPVMDQAADRQQADSSQPAKRTNAPEAQREPAVRNPQPSASADTKSKTTTAEARAERNVKLFRIPVSQTAKGTTLTATPSPVEPPPNLELAAAQPPRPTVLTVAIPVPPPEPRPSPQAAAAPLQPTTAASAQASPATPPTVTRSNYVGPRPIQQVRPQLPANMPTGVSQVQILVEIDTRGKVIQATPIGWSALNAPLMVWAIRAVSSWVFEPGRLNGKPVQSEMNLIFRF